MDKPRVRYVDTVPIKHEEEVFLVLRDPEELFGEELIVPPVTFFLMTLLDGTRDVREVQAEIMRQTQQLVPMERIEEVVRQLDESYLLANERSAQRKRELEKDFENLPVRPMAHAGQSYPADPEELVTNFDSFFSAATGPGDLRETVKDFPKGLVIPHIDFRCGGSCMAWGYDTLKRADPPDCYILLGVAHHPAPNLFTITDKDFETPFGPARANTEAIGRLRELFGAERCAGEYAHKSEHSVEFPAVFLKYLHREDHDFSIIPILCGSLHEEVMGADPEGQLKAEAVEFASAVSTLIEEMDAKVCVVASVDLSHVGKKFGDTQGIDEVRSELIRAADLSMLDNVTQRDAEGWLSYFSADQNSRNVDAVSAVYAMLHMLGPGTAELLRYEQHREHETESLVSYASMALY